MESTLKLASIFGSHMVLQRNRPVRIWGHGQVGETVSVTLAGRHAQTLVEADGSWLLELPEISAGGPFELQVKSDDEEIRYTNVLIGDVWICSGQSNMEWPVSASLPEQTADNLKSYPMIRLFSVAHTASLDPAAGVAGQWRVASSDSINNFSAVGFFFGRELVQSLDVPIGLINASWGGTFAEAWTPRETLLNHPDLSHLAHNPSAAAAPGPHVDPGNQGESRGWHKRETNDSSWATMDLPCYWQSAGLKHNGAVWFRKHVRVPAHWNGESLILHLGALDDFDTVYFNGHEIGRTGAETVDFWAARREYVVPERFVRADDNVIAVRVFDQWGNGGFAGVPNDMKLVSEDDPKSPIPLAGKWAYCVELELPQRDAIIRITNSSLYNGMIHPYVGFGISGVIWYQGESNAQRGNVKIYRTLLASMIRSWRDRWNQGNFPFIIVQLANYGQDDTHQDSPWAELREAQHKVAIAEPNCGLACALDLGEPADIHPRNKIDVARRLAQEALRVAHNHKNTAQSPVYRSHKIMGNAVEIEFGHADAGLKSDGPVIGFHIAAIDQQFHPAAATIQGNKVIVQGGDVAHPIAVRYGWRGNPNHTLRSANGLPVMPFRTDDW